MGVYIRLMSFSHGPHARWVGNSLAEFERDLADNLCYERGTTAVSASAQDTYWTLAVTVRDRLADRRARTTEVHYAANPKFVYYLSAEYMLGRQLTQNAVSEQISLAGKEASGTGNMKLALNGAITIGTLDGANIEIRDRVGPGNFFLFGLTADQATTLRQRGYSPRGYYRSDAELKAAIDTLTSDAFTAGERGTVQPLIDSLLRRDEYMVLADYRPYIDCQDQSVEPAWADQDRWTQMSILNTARSGFFYSDRTVRGYCRDIWHAKQVPVAADTAAAQEPLIPGS